MKISPPRLDPKKKYHTFCYLVHNLQSKPSFPFFSRLAFLLAYFSYSNVHFLSCCHVVELCVVVNCGVRCGLVSIPKPIQDGGVVPSMLGTCFLTRPRELRCSVRGTPWIERGSRMSERSRRAGIRVITERYSPGKVPLGRGTVAVRQR